MSNKIKVFHEVPFELLELSRDFTDGDYCLPHLMDQDEIYRNYFYDSKQQGRYIIMDNSLHELGTAYDTDRLLHWINELKPNEFIVPDVWENTTQSVVNARKWSQIRLPDEVTKVAVVQATSIGDAITCYQTYKDLGYKKIAFSYGASYYNDISDHPHKDLGKALGRIKLISQLYKNQIISATDRVHLLGCAVPQEFGWYVDMPFIESIDTSNPIMAALEGTAYTFNGLTEKPKLNMNQAQTWAYDNIDLGLLKHNVDSFRLINNLK
jgi:hypothetical protein